MIFFQAKVLFIDKIFNLENNNWGFGACPL